MVKIRIIPEEVIEIVVVSSSNHEPQLDPNFLMNSIRHQQKD